MAKYLGLGITLSVDSGGFVVLGQVRDISGPTAETGEVDVTARDSTALWMEFLGASKNPGEVTFDLVYDPALATHNTLTTLFTASTEANWRLTYAAATDKRAIFAGYVKAFQPSAPLEDRLGCSCTVKVTKAITWHEDITP